MSSPEILDVPPKEPLHSFTYLQNHNDDFNFTLIHPNGQLLHKPFMCKDYIQDILWSEATGKKILSIYGLRWEPGWFPLKDLSRLKLLIEWKKKFPPSQSDPRLLHAFEDALTIERSVIHPTPKTSALIVDFDRGWCENSVLISAFTSLVRLTGAQKEGETARALIERYAKPLYKDDFSIDWIPDPYYTKPEAARMSILQPRLLKLLAGQRSTIKWGDLDDPFKAHNSGIYGYPWY